MGRICATICASSVLFSSSFALAQEARKIPQRQVVSDTAPFELWRLHDSFCQYRGFFEPRGGGRTVFSISKMGDGSTSFKFSLFGVPWADEVLDAAGQTKVGFVLADKEGKGFAGGTGKGLVLKSESNGKTVHSVTPMFFLALDNESDFAKADQLRISYGGYIMASMDLPKGGAHFAAELARCDRGENLEYVDEMEG